MQWRGRDACAPFARGQVPFGCGLSPSLIVKQPSVVVRCGEGAGCPWSFSAPEKNEGSRAPTGAGAEAPHPVTRLATRSISENAQRSPAGSPAGAPLDALLRCLPCGAGPRFLGICAGQPAPGRRISPPGGAPTPPVRRLTRPGTRAPHRRRPGFRRAPATRSAGLISGRASRLAPSNQRHRLTPLDEQGPSSMHIIRS